MDAQKDASTNGILTAAALTFAALLILLGETKPYTRFFSLEALPNVLRKAIETYADGVIVTAVIVRKRQISGDLYTDMSNNVAAAVMLNMMRDEFGLREKKDEKKDDDNEV